MGKKSYYKRGGTNPQSKAKPPTLNRSVSVSSSNILPMRRMKENLSALRKSLKEKEQLLSDYRKQNKKLIVENKKLVVENKKLVVENKKISRIATDLLFELENTQAKCEKFRRFFMNTRDGMYRL